MGRDRSRRRRGRTGIVFDTAMHRGNAQVQALLRVSSPMLTILVDQMPVVALLMAAGEPLRAAGGKDAVTAMVGVLMGDRGLTPIEWGSIGDANLRNAVRSVAFQLVRPEGRA